MCKACLCITISNSSTVAGEREGHFFDSEVNRIMLHLWKKLLLKIKPQSCRKAGQTSH